MRQTKRTSKNRKNARSPAARSRKPALTRAKAKRGKRAGLSFMAAMQQPQRYRSLQDALKFYKPLKKPITVRLDADVLAWFKKDGKRYQSRINQALRKVMMREMRASGR